MNDKWLQKLARISKDLRLKERSDLCDIALCAYAAIADVERPMVDLSYTSIMRDLRKNDPDKVEKFAVTFRDRFYEALDAGIEDPANIALMHAIDEIDYNTEGIEDAD